MKCPKTLKNIKISVERKLLTLILPIKKCPSPRVLFHIFLLKKENIAKIALRGTYS